jgi:hypothetical protein
MTKSAYAAAALVAGGILFCASTALAQSSAPTPSRQPNGATPYRQPSDSQSTAQDEGGDVRAPVLRVISVEVIRSTHGNALDIVRVRGLTSTPGWEDAELVPLTHGVPKDGVLEFIFVARAPTEATEATGFEPIEAIFPIESGHPYKGVNVHSASESLELVQLPGYAEGRAAGEDCSKCVGKVFVPKGGAVPSGKTASQVVREEDLPATLRVIRHADGIPSDDSNPNRLTLVLGKDGTITAAIWD